jgi:hypothetical protein
MAITPVQQKRLSDALDVVEAPVAQGRLLHDPLLWKGAALITACARAQSGRAQVLALHTGNVATIRKAADTARRRMRVYGSPVAEVDELREEIDERICEEGPEVFPEENSRPTNLQ